MNSDSSSDDDISLKRPNKHKIEKSSIKYTNSDSINDSREGQANSNEAYADENREEKKHSILDKTNRLDFSEEYEESQYSAREPDEATERFTYDPEEEGRGLDQSEDSKYEANIQFASKRQYRSKTVMSNMILKDDCSYSYIKLQCSLYNEDKKALEQIKLSRTGEESINNLKSKFTNNETPLYSIFQEIAQEYSYNHVYLIPPCSQPFVNIYPEECGFFEFMQQLYNEEIDTKHRRLWECELIKKEDLLLDVRIENRTKRFKKDSRKACIFIGKKEQVLTFVNFINEQLEVMDQLTKTKINYNHSKVRIEDINNIIEELNPRVVSSKDNASNGSNSRYEESKESKEETKEESIGCNDLLETPLGSSSQTKFFTRRTRGARERPYGFFLLSNPKNAEILIYALISDQYKLYWEDRLRGMEDVTLPDSLSNSPENFMTCEKCQVLLEERLCEERLRDINFTQAFRPENKEIFLNTQDRINQSLRKHVYPGFFNKVVVHDTSITWKTICKRKERKEKEREFYNTINKIAEEQDMGRKIIKISPDEELIEIRENIKA